MAQLVAHHTGSVGVRGSSPLSSTRETAVQRWLPKLRRGRRNSSRKISDCGKLNAQKNRGRNTYRVLWRQDGRQRSLTFENLPAAERLKTLWEDHGPDEALRIIELDEIGRRVPTVTDWLHTHIDNRPGWYVPSLSLPGGRYGEAR
jgi:hypothetical protein